jgi:hypothetical protein
MKSIASVISAFLLGIFPLFVLGQCCDYTLSMQDSYGDGWQGGTVDVRINGSSIGVFSGVNAASIETFQVCEGDAVSLVYSPGDWENENSYQLYDAVSNVLFADGPDPQVGNVFATNATCSAPVTPGMNPCNAIALEVGACAFEDNTAMPGSGLNPGCAEYQGSDIWFAVEVPLSGNLSFVTDSGSINDTGVSVWRASTCLSPQNAGCDDDNGVDYFSSLLLYDLTPDEIVYVQVWGYGGATGEFRLCVTDLGSVVLDSTTLPIVMINTLDQTIVAETKIDALMDIKYNGLGNQTRVTDVSNVYSGNIGIEIRGASSSGYPQRPYGLETRLADGSNNNVSLLGMPPENDWVLLSNYNDRSLIRNSLAYDLFREMGNYSVRTILCEVLIDSAYKGIYTFTEKIKKDNNRVDIATLTPLENKGDDLTGGYILQQNYWDDNNSFQSNYGPIDHPELDVHFIYHYPEPEVITPQQKNYIAAYIDSLEDALYSPNFDDTLVGYRNYLDVPSFIDYFLINELSRSNDGFKKSVFYHKDKYSNGGKLKAGPVWDFDWAWKNIYGCVNYEGTDGSGWAHLINDCGPDVNSTGWYIRLLQDSTFANELRCTYNAYRQTMLSNARINTYIDSVGNLVAAAQARHFQKWPVLGVSGPAPEVGAIATTYAAELDTLKHWIDLRLTWLDANLPGNCIPPIVTGIEASAATTAIRYYPNPSSGMVHFEGQSSSTSPLRFEVYDMTGKRIESLQLPEGQINFDYHLKHSGVYSFTLSNDNAIVQRGKLVVL